MAELVTPVEYAKLIGIAPQQVYGMIKRGLPTQQAEHKGKMRDLVDPEKANEWLALYETTKRTRKSRDDGEEGEGDENSPRSESSGRQPIFKGGELIVHARGKKNIAVSRIKAPDEEHFAYLERNMYTFPFMLNKTVVTEWFLNPNDLKRKILNREMILEAPLQVMEYALAQIEVARPELSQEIREVIEKHLAATENDVAIAEKTSYNYIRR